jgi:hypothetical protein
MREKLEKRTKELKRAADWLQDRGWVVTKFALEVEDDGDSGMLPWGTLVLRYDPEKPTDVL